MASGRTVRQVKQGERLRRSQTNTSLLSSSSTPLTLEKTSNGTVPKFNTNPNVEVEGYGPYKPVPPPKPLQQQQQQQQYQDSQTPPPYRMPPYPLFGVEQQSTNSGTIIPGAASSGGALEGGTTANPIVQVLQQQGLHTHSNKFPIEREVILSSTDKNSKIPILNDYLKRANKGAVAPDVPPKQMAAWTNSTPSLQQQQQQQQHQQQQLLLSATSTDQNHSTGVQQQEQSVLYRATYHASSAPTHHQDFYNGAQTSTSGAVPRVRSQQYPEEYTSQQQQQQQQQHQAQPVLVQIEQQPKEFQKDSAKKDSKSMTKTYHTIKDIIQGRFKGTKESADEVQTRNTDEPGLNNATEELRRSQRNLGEDEARNKQTDQMVKTASRGTAEGMPSTNHQYVIQQQMIHAQQQQFKMQQQQQQQLAYDEQMMYGQNRRGMIAGRDQNFMQQSQQQQIQQQYLIQKDLIERRSAQQLERDNQRRSFEARRAASQPQLAFDDETELRQLELHDHRPQPQQAAAIASPLRRGSYGNIVDAVLDTSVEKDSDDGGFLKRVGSKERKLEDGRNEVFQQQQQQMQQQLQQPNMQQQRPEVEGRVSEVLQGSPRKRLEGEIGRIEGVYNVGQRTARIEDHNKKILLPGSGTSSSDYDKTGGQSSSNVDSGRGSAAYSSGRRQCGLLDGEQTDGGGGGGGGGGIGGNNRPDSTYREHGNDSEWVDTVESELRQILEPKLHELTLHGNAGIANSTLSESISSMTPPLPPLSPGEHSSPNETPRNSTRYKQSSLPYGSKPEYDSYNKSMKLHNARESMGGNSRWHNSTSNQKHSRSSKKNLDHPAIMRGKQHHSFGLDTTDIASTTTRSLDLESMLDDGQSDTEGDEMSASDARTIRKQLEGLETMYGEVLKLLGVNNNKKYGSATNSGRYQPSDPRFSKRRYGSMSSLPSSSVSSRPIRDKRRSGGGIGGGHDDRKKVRDIRGVNKRFQRLESHVVTLARSVAHLSSEMRTQHLMMQEMESIRTEIAALRTQTTMLNVRTQSASRVRQGAAASGGNNMELPTLANPARVKKLTKFFGDEPPLLRLFLRQLGYEKYANVFENEKVGMIELPYLSEERLQKMGVPMGPRLRIMQEAQISVCDENTLCVV